MLPGETASVINQQGRDVTLKSHKGTLHTFMKRSVPTRLLWYSHYWTGRLSLNQYLIIAMQKPFSFKLSTRDNKRKTKQEKVRKRTEMAADQEGAIEM